jgi:hypothetical protein
MLVGMALEPEWIAEMAMDYAKAIVGMQEILFSKEGKPDGIWFYEDMGFKQRPLCPRDVQRVDTARAQIDGGLCQKHGLTGNNAFLRIRGASHSRYARGRD